MCLNFFKHHPCGEGGQKEAKVERYGKPIENVSISPAPLDSPFEQSLQQSLLFFAWKNPACRQGTGGCRKGGGTQLSVSRLTT